MPYTVYISDDYDLKETIENIGKKLEEKGVRVIRGPRTVKGIKLEIDPKDYPKYFAEAEVALFSSRSRCPGQLIRWCPKLRGLVVPTIGSESIDLKTANELNIPVANGACPENYIGVAEANVLLTLMLLYDPNRSADVLRKNLPKPTESQTWARQLWKRTVGIVGLGRIGRAYAQRLQGWDVRMIAYDPYVKPETVPDYIELVDLDTLLKESDIVDTFLVVTDETRDMADYDFFCKMKPTAYFINTSRGQIVEEDGLCRALSEKRIAGAGLDTFKTEPLPQDSPLRKFDNVFLTPHLIGHTYECQMKFADLAVENIMALLEGRDPVYCVNPAVLPEWRKQF